MRKLIRAGTVITFLLLLPPTFSASRNQQADPPATQAEDPGPLDRANQFIADGKLGEAIGLLSRYKQGSPLDPHAYFLAGLAFTQLQDWNAAAAELKEALRLDPENPEYTILHANVLTRLGHNELAVQSLQIFQDQEALEDITTAWAWLLSDAFFRAGANDDALRILDLISDRDPADPRTDLNRGQIYYVKGDHEKARDFIERSISKQPEKNPVAYYELGKTLEQLGDAAGAKAAFLEALSQDAGNAEYLWKLGAACLALGESREAIGYLQQALPSADEYPEIYYVLGRAYQAEKDRAKAAEALKKFQQISAGDRREQYQRIEAGKLVGRGEEALERGDLREARFLFQQALKKNPKDWAAHGYLAEITLGTGAIYAAGRHLEQMRDLDPDHPVGLYLSARYWYERGEMETARQYAEQVRLQRPGNAELRNLLGNIYLTLGRVEEAVAEYQAAVRLAPDRNDFQLNLSAAKKRLP